MPNYKNSTHHLCRHSRAAAVLHSYILQETTEREDITLITKYKINVHVRIYIGTYACMYVCMHKMYVCIHVFEL